MRVSLIGHATYLFETEDLTLLTDPIFHDDYLDGTAESCPRRQVRPEQLPEIDLLFISHRHHDHFDIPTLATLQDRVGSVICPEDRLVVQTLEQLGFDEIQTVRDDVELRVGETRIQITPSKLKVPEHGFILEDPSGLVWNQVDTVVDPSWVPGLFDGRRLDVHLASYQPVLLREHLSNGDTRFPYEEYASILEVMNAASARIVVPSAAGFCFRGSHAWLNHYWFPATPTQFAEDLTRLSSRIEIRELMPGDAITLTDDGPRIQPGFLEEIVQVTEDTRAQIQFWPTHSVPPLSDDDRFGRGFEFLANYTDALIDKINARLTMQPLTHFDLLRRWGVVMRLRVHLPRGLPRDFALDFREETPRFEEQPGPARFVLEVTASGLYGLLEGLHWDGFLVDGFRCFDTLYRIDELGLRVPPCGAVQGRMAYAELPAPIDLFLVLCGATEEAWVQGQLRATQASRT